MRIRGFRVEKIARLDCRGIRFDPPNNCTVPCSDSRFLNHYPTVCLISPNLVRTNLRYEGTQLMRAVILVLLVLLLLGALPTWPYSASWGYYPSGGLGLVLIVVLVLAVAGRI